MNLQKEQEVWKLLNNLTLGENGEVAFKSTGDKNLDLFGTVNRDVKINVLVTKFIEAWNENPEYAIKVLLNFRDIREGKGEKLISKIMLFIVKVVHPDIYEKMVPLFVEIGCWKDLLFLYEMGLYYGINSQVEIKEFANQLAKDQKAEHPSLCAKWSPTEGCHFDRKTKVAKKIMKTLGVNAKEYRKILTELRTKIKIVETQLSQQHTSEINFSAIPSRAHLLYKKAFMRETNAEGNVVSGRSELKERYQKYLDDLKSGKEKANFKGIMPHELVRSILQVGGNDTLIENQWNSIRSEIENLSVFDKCVSIVDVSGSMESGGLGANTPRPIDIAIALGILVSECSKGPFNNKMFTFHENPTLSDLSSLTTLYTKVRHTKDLPWGGSTDVEAVFQKILDTGILMNIPQEQMPERLFIFTDMQFNEVSGSRLKTFDKIKEKFNKHGYSMPQIICWNLRTVDNVVFTKDDKDVCMLSGFSTPILKAFLTCKEISPLIVFLSAINHYKLPDIALKPIQTSVDINKIEDVVKKCDFKYVEEKKSPKEKSPKEKSPNILDSLKSGNIKEIGKNLSSAQRVELARQLLELDGVPEAVYPVKLIPNPVVPTNAWSKPLN